MVQSIDDARRRQPRSSPGRVPPHNLQAEESLLGAMLLSKDAISAAVEICTADDFYKPAHGHVFEAVVSLYGLGEPADPVTVAEELRRADLLEAIGGPSVLTDLQAHTPAVSNAARYARIVEELALLRRLIGVAGEIAELGYSLPEDVEAAVDRAEAMVFDVAQRRAADTLVHLNDLLRASLDHLEKLYERNEAITGTPTGYTDLDELLSGLQPSALNVVGARPGAGKALALGTPIPTPSGWATMGHLAAGDSVFDERGAPCRVTYVSPVYLGRRCYEVGFDDATVIVADAEHRWLADDRAAPGGPEVVTTAEMARRGVRPAGGGGARWRIPPAGPLDLPEADLPVDPYIVGCRLAAAVEAAADVEIPGAYLRASFKQRLALVQGLMDSAGRPCGRGRSVALRLPGRRLSEQARELVCSLGHRPGPLRPRVAVRPGGDRREWWRLSWTPLDPVFRRSGTGAARGDVAGTGRRRGGRAVVAIREVGSVPVRCIAVDSPSHLYLAGTSMVPTHNTAFALGIAAHAAIEARKPVLLFSLEMSHHEVTQRLLSAEAKVDSTRLRNGRLLEADWNKIGHAIGRLSESPLYIDDNPNVTVMEIRAKARRMKSRLGDLGVIIVDYLQLMTGRKAAENRQVEVSEISRGLKILARELNTPVVALSQLSRGLEMRAEKRPVLADLRESGCMPASTKVLRADNGEEISMGELLLTQQQPLVWSLGSRHELVPARLTKTFASGIKPVFRLRLASGRTVEATANHPFLTVDGWSRLDSLGAGSFIAVPRRLPAPLTRHDKWSDDDPVQRVGLGRSQDGRPEAGTTDRQPATALAEGCSGSHLPGGESRPRRLSGAPLAAMADVGSAEREQIATSDVSWDEVVEVTAVGDQPTFDVTIEGTHNFVADGVIAHNSIEQDSDVVMFIYRDELYNPDSADRGTAEIIVAKHRNGPTGVTQLAFLDRYTRFANMAKV